MPRKTWQNEKYEPNPCSPSCETNGCPDDVEMCSGRPGVPVPDDYDKRRREALGCTHPNDEPCFGVGPIGKNDARHNPPPQPMPEPGNADAAPSAYDPPPDHYSTGAGIDPWQVWDAFGLDRDAYLANATKYILRAGKKEIAPKLDDLIKARNYINKAIEREQRNG